MQNTQSLAVSWQQISAIHPHAGNLRKITEFAIDKVASSIKEFGWRQPIVTDEGGEIVVGHVRYAAAQKLGMSAVPVHVATGLTPAQIRAYRLADNRTHEETEWNFPALQMEMADLKMSGFDLALAGFDSADFGMGHEPAKPAGDIYSRKIAAPVYEPKGERPAPFDLFDATKTEELEKEIGAASIPEDVATFLRAAAQRHTVFDFRRIAEFYAQADSPIQSLMERSALVIIDFDKAIESGFVRLTKAIGDLVTLEGEGDA